MLKTDIRNLGLKRDQHNRAAKSRSDNEHLRFNIKRVRRWMFTKGTNINSKAIEDFIGHQSFTPTLNAFSQRLSPYGFNHFKMYVPDAMHEFEIGVWKACFVHLLRILYAYGHDTIQELNNR